MLPVCRIVPGEERFAERLRDAMDTVGHEGRYMGFVDAPPVDIVRTIIRQVSMFGGVQRLALDERDHVAGWCQISRPGPAALHHAGQLGMAVLPEYRGTGLARRLALDTIAAAHERGIQRVELDVFTTNRRAQRFFQSLGFEHEGTKRAAYKVGSAFLDAYSMVLLAPGFRALLKEDARS